jgi:ferrochelatase
MYNKERVRKKLPMMTLLLISYGAPERQEDVVPFLNNLFAGKNVPPQRINTAAEKYQRYADKTGHYSPLNNECRLLINGIQRELHLPQKIYWGNLFWNPLLTETVAEMKRDGIKRAACFATSVFDSPAGNQRYADALEAAGNVVVNDSPILEKLPLTFDHLLFIEAQTDVLLEPLAWNALEPSGSDPKKVRILFSAHSIPKSDADRCDYVKQLHFACRSVIEKSGTPISWELVFQSRSGVGEHWLGPDVKDRIRELAAEGFRSVIVSPLGFLCENMETEYDLDIETGELCAELGIGFYRARAVGAAPQICRLIAGLVQS